MSYPVMPLEQRIQQLEKDGNASLRTILSMQQPEWFDIANRIAGHTVYDPADDWLFDDDGNPYSMRWAVKLMQHCFDRGNFEDVATRVGIFFCLPFAEISEPGEVKPEKDPSQEMLDMLEELFGIDIGEE